MDVPAVLRDDCEKGLGLMYSIKHKFVTAKADGTDTTLVKPTNWNDEHDLTMDEGTVIGRPPGSGSGPGQSIPISSLYMTGMMSMFAGGTAPTGWLLCNGQSVLRSDYLDLFNIIGTAYGSVDGAHFNVPDMRGRVAAHPDGGTNRLTTGTIGGAGPNVPGGAGGAEQASAAFTLPSIGVTVGSWYGGGSFGGGGYTSGSLSAHVSGNVYYSGDGWGGANGSGVLHGNHLHYADLSGDATGSLGVTINSFGATGGTNGYSGAATARAVQPTLIVNFIIKT
jgi:Phage Tail Collar Domain